jgi:pectate lyase
MRGKYRPHHILEVALLVITLAGFSASNSKANENSKYLDAVREFADNVLKYGRDTYGPKHTPLFVDGLNIQTHEPVKWIAPNGDRWILSNLASQQNLFRTLDGLTTITGDPKYKQAAMEAIEYAFANLQNTNGLLYWGVGISYDAKADKQCGMGIHCLKCNYPYYKLMWKVNPTATRKFIEGYWSTHILNWSNLDMNRGVPVDKPAGEAWNHEYKGGPVFFQSTGIPFLVAGSDLFYAAGFLKEASGDNNTLLWAKRLMQRYVETRNPCVGISGAKYTRWITDRAQVQLGEDYKGHLVLTGTLFPSHPEMGNPASLERAPAFSFVTPGVRNNPAIAPWVSAMLLGDMLDADGKKFIQWALEELTAWGKVAYRKEDNSFIPMLLDGTSLEGYVCKKSGDYGIKGTVFVSIQTIPMDFWAYALAYRLTGDQFMWDMARNIASGHGLGDIGFAADPSPRLTTATDSQSPYTLLGFIELYRKTDNQKFIQIGRRIGDNLLNRRFHKGFFVPSDTHIYAKFDAMEHLALLQLHAALTRSFSSVPEFWPSNSLFNAPYRDREYASDYTAIYTLTESPYPAKSGEELIASGDIEGVRLFIAQGRDINALSESGFKTLLHLAAIKGDKDIMELILAVKHVQINAEDELQSTPLHYAVQNGYKEVAELLIAKGTDINAKDNRGITALHLAAKGGQKEMVELLITKGADVNASNIRGRIPLDFARRGGYTEIAELLRKHESKEDKDPESTPRKEKPSDPNTVSQN